MKRLKKDFEILARGYKIIFSIDKMHIPLNIINAILQAISPFIFIYMGAEILNALSRGENLGHIYFLFATMIVLNVLSSQIIKIISHAISIKNSVFEHKFNMYLNNKTLEMDYGDIENPEVHLKRQRIFDLWAASGGKPTGIWKLVYQSGDAVSGIAAMIASIVVTYKAFTIYSIVPQNNFVNILTSPLSSVILLVFILANTLITIYFNGVDTVKSHNIRKEELPHNRMLIYIFLNYINTYHAGKDIRLYNQKQMIMTNIKNALGNFEVISSKMERNQIKYTNINTLLSSAIEWLVYIFIGVRALYGLIGLGDLFKYINAINQFSWGLNGFLNTFNSLRVNNQHLEVLYDYLDIPNKKYQGTISVEKRDDNEYEIEFRNVSFKYPGSENYALKNVSLKLNVGQRLAVVGQNGSGKTTMIKLLCRLYDPTEGIITLNGIDIKKYDYDEYMAIFSVVFQDFKLFSFGLGQNVAASVNYDGEKVAQTLAKSGFGARLDDMPKGTETNLYKDFEEDGVEISGGEAQKIALARALYKDAPFIVLDEPTAALDPIAEYEIYTKFDEIVGDKTAIYISHRLSSCRFCDDIAVFCEGELVQRGSHESLLADLGKYSELWNAQAQHYV
ncbi:MAG: ABC transporter ATP-binding protein/permease [Oscillospiraceae bacterium]|nr:ABC transporter ATP-binding protein/permease [Oscillospiraceae bacterium]